MKFINAVVALYEKVKGDVMKLYNVSISIIRIRNTLLYLSYALNGVVY
jgi:hypothetical protein